MKDEEFFAKLLITFRIEAEEHLKALSDGLIAIESGLSQDQVKEKIEHIFREAHSLKGASRAVNQQPIEKICQTLENVLADWKQGQLQPSSKMFDTLYATIDALKSAMEVSPDQETVSKIIQQLEGIRSSPSSTPAVQSLSPPDIKAKEEKAKSSEPEKSIPPLKKEKTAGSETLENKLSSTKETFKDQSIRVSLQKMNQIFQEAEEMLTVKLIAQQQVMDLRQLYTKQCDQEKELGRLIADVQILRQTLQSEKGIQYKKEATKKVLTFLNHQQKEIKSSNENLNKLVKVSEQNSHFIESMIDTLMEDMKKVLMQPVNTLFEVIPHIIRNTAHELGKEVHVEFQGGDIEVDRRILEEIKDPMIHLIRNAIDHGIESPQERAQMNKSSFGTIKILATESGGNNVALSIIDDGKGIDIGKLKSAAIQQGILSQKEAMELTEEAAIKLAFQSGVSTSPIVTEISGRGLGLGIVSEKADRLGGQVVIDSQLGQGTKFTLILPLTLATFRGIHITVANQDFIMPTHNVKRVLRLKRDEIHTIANSEAIFVEDRSIPYIHLADLLGLVKKTVPDQSPSLFGFVIIVSAIDKTIAFGIDYLHREQEVLVKGLGRQCVRVKNVMAATIMEKGNIVPVLNPIDLIRSSIKGKIVSRSFTPEQQQVSAQKEILLAEDSITTRLLLKNILESAGYKVKTAVDGLEALEFLRIQPVDLLLTDVEMPRMDGFTLVEKLREMDSLKDIPIIMCTSRGSKEDRERGIELGANAYLDKSRFTQQELINILKKML